MQLKNDVNLIGDLAGTVPVMIDLAKKYGGLEVEQTLDEGKWIYDLIPKKYNIKLVDKVGEDALETDLSEAFLFAGDVDVHMTQAHHAILGLPTPEEPIRPELDIPDLDVPVYDYVFAPFGRSAGQDEKWPYEKWNELAWYITNLGLSVCVLGNSKYDQKNGHEIQYYVDEYDRPLVEVLNMLKKCRRGCLSIITGISHLCYATGTKNYLFSNQWGKWGVNPDAIKLETHIPRIDVDDVLCLIIEK